MSAIAGFHYHFYQPPREDPWTGLFNHEWSAWPYHDWNERIAAECYRAMVAVALPDDDGTTSLFEPLTQSSFDLGPTLHHWLSTYAPDVEHALQRQVRAADHGASRVVVAAPLVHAIVPLATPIDQDRLIVWGIDDFRARYGDEPIGMWLPETGGDDARAGGEVAQGRPRHPRHLEGVLHLLAQRCAHDCGLRALRPLTSRRLRRPRRRWKPSGR